MNLGLQLRLRIAMRCRTCGQLDHDARCPIALMDAAASQEPLWRCPKCRGIVQVTIDDFLQCHSCHTRYTFGIGAPENAERVILIRTSEESAAPALVLPSKKRAGFKLNVLLKNLRAQAVEWRRARRGKT